MIDSHQPELEADHTQGAVRPPLQFSQSLFQSFMDHAPTAAYVKDEQGRYVYLNTFCKQLFGNLVEKTDFEVFSPEIAESLHQSDREVLATNQPQRSEETTVSPSGRTQHWMTSKFPFHDSHGQRYIAGMSIDVTERKLAQDAIRKSENRLQAILDNTTAVIYLKDSDGRYLMINRRYEDLAHVTQEETLGKTDQDLFPPEVAAKVRANDQTVLESGTSVEFEESVPQDDGIHTFVSVKFPIYDPIAEKYAVGGISTDISDRTRATEFLRHIIESQEQERRLVAYEIHDGLVQHATGALMHVDALQAKVESASVAEELDIIQHHLRNVVKEGRRLINGIRTPVLDDLGLVPALEQLVMEKQRTSFRIDLTTDPTLGRLPTQVEVALFRITQEALTNAQKHSGSESVRIDLGRRGDCIRLGIRDEGIGFNPAKTQAGVHGLKGMTERSRMLGGQCTVDSSPGKGTRIIVELPCPESSEVRIITR